MASHFVFVEVRPIEVRAYDPTQAGLRVGVAAPQRPRALQERDGLLVAGNRAGRDNAGRSVAGVRASHGLERLDGAVHEVGVVPAVHVEIDKPGGHETTGRVDVILTMRPARAPARAP